MYKDMVELIKVPDSYYIESEPKIMISKKIKDQLEQKRNFHKKAGSKNRLEAPSNH